jgi:hypothetical protein
MDYYERLTNGTTCGPSCKHFSSKHRVSRLASLYRGAFVVHEHLIAELTNVHARFRSQPHYIHLPSKNVLHCLLCIGMPISSLVGSRLQFSHIPQAPPEENNLMFVICRLCLPIPVRDVSLVPKLLQPSSCTHAALDIRFKMPDPQVCTVHTAADCKP